METRRAYCESLEVRTVDGRRELTGVAIRYGTVTQPYLGFAEFRERFQAGAFTDSLANPVRDIVANWNHDRTFQLGSMKAGTLRFEDTPTELRFNVSVFKQFDWVVDLVESGEARGSSIEFAMPEIRFDMVEGNRVETVTQAMLRGVAVVNAPAYEDAQVEVARRSFEEWRATQVDGEEVDDEEEEDEDRKGDHGQGDERAQQEAMLIVEDILAGSQIAPEGAEEEASDG